MTEKEKTKISKFISLVLRHKPETIDLKLDKNGWVNVKELIKKSKANGRNFSMSDLEDIVLTDNKQRYSFNKEKTLIRANQGHSIDVDVELNEAIPPKVLYHGTAEKSLNSILNSGIKPMSRQYVHLSKDISTAINVGSRHGSVVVLEIDSKTMSDMGIKFYLSENGVWLTKHVDVKYINSIQYC